MRRRFLIVVHKPSAAPKRVGFLRSQMRANGLKIRDPPEGTRAARGRLATAPAEFLLRNIIRDWVLLNRANVASQHFIRDPEPVLRLGNGQFLGFIAVFSVDVLSQSKG